MDCARPSSRLRWSFNPRQPPRAGATAAAWFNAHHPLDVSILASRRGPALRGRYVRFPRTDTFQSSPAAAGRRYLRPRTVNRSGFCFSPRQPPRAGATAIAASCSTSLRKFQSSPAAAGRRYLASRAHPVPTHKGFNPRQPPRAGATATCWRQVLCGLRKGSARTSFFL